MPLLDKLTGLFQSGAAKVVDSIGDALDKNITNKEELAQAKLELEKEVNRHIEFIQSDTTKQLEAELKDMASARDREIQIAVSEKAPLINKVITPILAILIVSLTFIMWYAVLYKQFTNDNKDVVLFVLGSLSTLTAGCVNYYFGSSSGSHAKQKQIENMMK